jgi:hypothetical protein
MVWQGCPKNIKSLSLSCNEIAEMNWQRCPQHLWVIDLSNTDITKVNWQGCPSELKQVNLSFNEITEMVWEDCPVGLRILLIAETGIQSINWEGSPLLIDNMLPAEYLEEYLKYKKSNKFLENVSKPLKKLHIELLANTVLVPDNKISAFNVDGYKQNFYDMVAEVKELLA